MKEKKYKEDYAVRTTISEKGREKREVVYQGTYYRFAGGIKEKKHSLCWSSGCAGLFILAYLIYMKLNTPSSLCIYVMPIAAVALIPFVYWCTGIYTLHRCAAQMTRLQKETGIGQILRSSIACAVLLAMACTGDLVYMLVSLKERTTAELPGFALLCCAAIAALSSFRRVREVYEGVSAVINTNQGDEAPQ